MIKNPSWTAETCLLCENDSCHHLGCWNIGKKPRSFFRCTNCNLTFVALPDRPDRKEEKSEYLLHQNSPLDMGYQKFLQPLWGKLNPILDTLDKDNALGMDYGSGPNPVLKPILEAQGFNMLDYDPYFNPIDLDVYKESVQFIVASEVIEHFYNPIQEFIKMTGLLSAKGVMVLMSDFRALSKDISNWHYARQPSHVSFYDKKSFEFIAEKLRLKILSFSEQVVCLIKP